MQKINLDQYMTDPQCIRDFDLHGIVGIRVIGTSPRDCDVVSSQLGPIEGPLEREPDIVIRFVPWLQRDSELRLIGGHDCGFSGEHFFLLRGRNKSRVRVQLPIADLGVECCELVCKSGLSSIPLLMEVVNFTALMRGALPLHASAFEFNGTGFLCTGWAQGGKTETLLGFTNQGARFISDEWVYVLEDRICGIPEPMLIWDWHVNELPGFRARLPRGDRLRLRSLRQSAETLDRLSRCPGIRHLFPRKVTRRLVSLLNRQRFLEVLPEVIFGELPRDPTGSLDRLLFVLSHDSPEYRVQPVATEPLLESILASLEQERSALMEKHRMFQFAFPGRSNPRLIQASERERELLYQRLADVPALLVTHPYPMSPSRLFEVISTYEFEENSLSAASMLPFREAMTCPA